MPAASEPDRQDNLSALLARLLSSSALRQEFAQDPAGLLTRLGAGEEARRVLLAMSPEQLEAQAATLIGKRLHEVSQLLPRSAARNPRFAAEFHHYADSYWPAGYLRHWLDAWGFLQWLRARRQSISDCEWARCSFIARRGQLTFNYVADLPTPRGARRGLLILLKGRGLLPREWGLYLGG